MLAPLLVVLALSQCAVQAASTNARPVEITVGTNVTNVRAARVTPS